MSNLAVANMVQVAANTPQALGVGGGEEALPPDVFGQILAQQISTFSADPSAVPPTSQSGVLSGKSVQPAGKSLQPVDLMQEIVAPAVFAEQMSAALEKPGLEVLDQPLTVAENPVKVTSKGKLSTLDDDEKGDGLDSASFATDNSTAGSLGLVLGNLQPSAPPVGKDLPPATIEKSVLGLVSDAEKRSSRVQDAKDLPTAPVQAQEKSSMSAEFATQLSQSVEARTTDRLRLAQDTKHTISQEPIGNITVNSHVTPKMENVANAAPSSAGIPQQVGSPHWDTGLGDRVVWMIGSQTQTAQLHLNPPSLGPLEVRVNISDGQANLSFTTHQVVVRDAIDAATPRLREMMGESGLQMGSVSVNVGNFSQQQTQQDQRAFSGSQKLQDTLPVAPDISVSATTLSDDGGLVNLFA